LPHQRGPGPPKKKKRKKERRLEEKKKEGGTDARKNRAPRVERIVYEHRRIEERKQKKRRGRGTKRGNHALTVREIALDSTRRHADAVPGEKGGREKKRFHEKKGRRKIRCERF